MATITTRACCPSCRQSQVLNPLTGHLHRSQEPDGSPLPRPFAQTLAHGGHLGGRRRHRPPTARHGGPAASPLAQALQHITIRAKAAAQVANEAPCPRDGHRLTIAGWAASSPRMVEISPATVSSRSRRRFGTYPRRAGTINTYSRRELELLGLLAPLTTL